MLATAYQAAEHFGLLTRKWVYYDFSTSVGPEAVILVNSVLITESIHTSGFTACILS